MGSKHKRGDTPYSITDAQEAASLEARHRIRSYSVKMTLRVICFPLGAWLAHSVNFWLGIGLVLFATIIPWFAVITANAIRPATAEGGHWATEPAPKELTVGDGAQMSGTEETIHAHSAEHTATHKTHGPEGSDPAASGMHKTHPTDSTWSQEGS